MNLAVVAFDKDNQADTGGVGCTLGAGSKKHNNAHLPHVAYGIGYDAIDRSGEGANGTAAERSGLNIVEGIQPTLRARSTNSVAHTLRAEGHDASEDGTGRGVPIVAEARTVSWRGRGMEVGDEKANAAFQERGREGGRSLEYQENMAYLLNAPADGGRRQEMNVQTGMAVRRLTPVECCRLQGFSDDWLDLEPPLSDSAKYRMLGNAVCRNVAEWLGRRIVANTEVA